MGRLVFIFGVPDRDKVSHFFSHSFSSVRRSAAEEVQRSCYVEHRLSFRTIALGPVVTLEVKVVTVEGVDCAEIKYSHYFSLFDN